MEFVGADLLAGHMEFAGVDLVAGGAMEFAGVDLVAGSAIPHCQGGQCVKKCQQTSARHHLFAYEINRLLSHC
uniref:Uncharacterized protein n=1 Tax=Leersia perrieri TaxID=77586 RepID=A0A0D9V4K1_9ORYZ